MGCSDDRPGCRAKAIRQTMVGQGVDTIDIGRMTVRIDVTGGRIGRLLAHRHHDKQSDPLLILTFLSRASVESDEHRT